MGNGVCSRRQRRIFQCLLLVTVVCGMLYGGMVSYEMHKQLRRTEAMALKYQQHQESLSAQLQGKPRLRLAARLSEVGGIHGGANFRFGSSPPNIQLPCKLSMDPSKFSRLVLATRKRTTIVTAPSVNHSSSVSSISTRYSSPFQERPGQEGNKYNNSSYTVVPQTTFNTWS